MFCSYWPLSCLAQLVPVTGSEPSSVHLLGYYVPFKLMKDTLNNISKIQFSISCSYSKILKWNKTNYFYWPPILSWLILSSNRYLVFSQDSLRIFIDHMPIIWLSNLILFVGIIIGIQGRGNYNRLWLRAAKQTRVSFLLTILSDSSDVREMSSHYTTAHISKYCIY